MWRKAFWKVFATIQGRVEGEKRQDEGVDK